MANLPTSRRAFRRTDDLTPGTPKFKLVEEQLPKALPATSVLIEVHAVSLNYRDANIANGGNPWPVTPNGIPCNDAAGSVIAIGHQVKHLKIGDRVAPNIDTENLTNREPGRSWLAADEDGVLATHIIFDERVVCKLPQHLSWEEVSTIPCAGTTAWSALKGVGLGSTVLIQGTGGVALFALKLARAAGHRVILSSSSDAKLEDLQKRFAHPPLLTVNYGREQEWQEEVLRLTEGVGVDCVVEVGGSSTLIKSLKCTRRGGIVSQVGYLSEQRNDDFEGLLGLLIDRRVNLRCVNTTP
jgi:NADPH:quinone reductase-like Zn-dependent oxidoreductase